MSEAELKEIGIEIAELLKRKDFDSAGSKYDYALRMDRENKAAIRSDFERAITECVGNINESSFIVSSKDFEENSEGFKSLIECDFSLENSSGILIEIILHSNGKVYIEDISSYRVSLNA